MGRGANQKRNAGARQAKTGRDKGKGRADAPDPEGPSVDKSKLSKQELAKAKADAAAKRRAVEAQRKADIVAARAAFGKGQHEKLNATEIKALLVQYHALHPAAEAPKPADKSKKDKDVDRAQEVAIRAKATLAAREKLTGPEQEQLEKLESQMRNPKMPRQRLDKVKKQVFALLEAARTRADTAPVNGKDVEKPQDTTYGRNAKKEVPVRKPSSNQGPKRDVAQPGRNAALQDRTAKSELKKARKATERALKEAKALKEAEEKRAEELRVRNEAEAAFEQPEESEAMAASHPEQQPSSSTTRKPVPPTATVRPSGGRRARF
jgi:hypothetical protein